MTREQAIRKCIKKAWPQIRAIKYAANMLIVESLINDALTETFGLRDMGIVETAMKHNFLALLKEYGADKYDSIVDLKKMRYGNSQKWNKEVRMFLVQFIPQRLHTSTMYRNLIDALPDSYRFL